MSEEQIDPGSRKDQKKYFRGLLTSRNLSVKLVDFLELSRDYFPPGYLTQFKSLLPEKEKLKYREILGDILKAREQERIQNALKEFGLITKEG